MSITHNHHIIPRHAGGSDDPSNIVSLTIKEHSDAHKTLYEQYGRWQDYLAWKGLEGIMNKEDIVKEKLLICASLGGKSWKGRKHSQKTKEKMSKSAKGRKPSKAALIACMKYLKSDKNKKSYRFINKNGQVYNIHGLQDFCMEHNLSKSAMSQVAKGIRNQHKGWKALV